MPRVERPNMETVGKTVLDRLPFAINNGLFGVVTPWGYLCYSDSEAMPLALYSTASENWYVHKGLCISAKTARRLQAVKRYLPATKLSGNEILDLLERLQRGAPDA
jgi:hypothetical protein